MAPLVTPLIPAQAGGAQAFAADLARALTERGHDLRLFCAAGSVVPGVAVQEVPVAAAIAAALVRPGGVTVERVPAVAEAFGRAAEMVRAWRPEVVSQHAFDAEAVDAPWGVTALHTMHLGPIVPGVVAAARRQPWVAVPSEVMRRDWEAAGVRSRVLRNGIPDFDPGAPLVEPLALIAGRVSPEKGVSEGIRAARALGLRPLVVGGVYDQQYFETDVRPLLGAGEYLPAQKRQDLWRLMAAAAVTLLPIAWEEPFGLVAAEAQVAGCPVAGYRRGALPEVVSEGVGGVLAEPGDFDALVAAARDAVRLDRAAVRASARERLLLDRSVEAYEAALAEVAA